MSQPRKLIAEAGALALLFVAEMELRGQTVLADGSFETPALSSTRNIVGSFTIGAWSGFAKGGGGNAGLVVGVDGGLLPEEGSQHFTFNGGNASSGTYLQQVFQTIPGATYTLTYWLGRSGASGSTLQLQTEIFDVASGAGTLLLSFASPPDSVGYVGITMSVVAASETTGIRFTDWSSANLNSDLYIDNVSMTTTSAIPEPSTTAIVGAAAALAWAHHRRRSLPTKCPPDFPS